MRIAVTGTTGQLVRSLVERGAARGLQIIPVGRPDLDLADGATVGPALAKAAPDVIVSAAAYTAVDGAECDTATAYAVNCEGAGSVAIAARNLGVPLVHLSTDYVFSGKVGRPRREIDPPAPLGVYGATKLAGERRVLAANPGNSAILRTAWVYSPFGANFVKAMLRLRLDRAEVAVVADQVGNPTSAFDLADGVLTVADNLVRSAHPELRGIFHIAGSGQASWADLAEEIFATAHRLDVDPARAEARICTGVRRISTRDYPTLARRPADSRLDCSRIARVHGVTLPSWRDALPIVVERLVNAPCAAPPASPQVSSKQGAST